MPRVTHPSVPSRPRGSPLRWLVLIRAGWDVWMIFRRKQARACIWAGNMHGTISAIRYCVIWRDNVGCLGAGYPHRLPVVHLPSFST